MGKIGHQCENYSCKKGVPIGRKKRDEKGGYPSCKDMDIFSVIVNRGFLFNPSSDVVFIDVFQRVEHRDDIDGEDNAKKDIKDHDGPDNTFTLFNLLKKSHCGEYTCS
jgi:hypothetical protein